jgi:hypothetical protein
MIGAGSQAMQNFTGKVEKIQENSRLCAKIAPFCIASNRYP